MSLFALMLILHGMAHPAPLPRAPTATNWPYPCNRATTET
jgi:hypothetical protein